METNWVVDAVREVEDELWVHKVNEIHREGRLCPWVSTFHKNKLPCQHAGIFQKGSFNAALKVVFSDNTAWMVRFPRGGKVCETYADEKVAMEVAALNIIREQTTIPVPKVHAWGLAASNTLGLGPFMMMDFIDGVTLGNILINPTVDNPTRLLREDIGDENIRFIYRQMANFLLQLFKLDFDRIGSLPWPGDEADSPARPLTFKAHSILQIGGVDTFGDRHEGFKTTTDYFQYLYGQDWQQFLQQPNSVFGPYDAKNKYEAFKTLGALIPNLINSRYNCGKFKLICDDLGLANLIVKSKDDFTVIGVVDLEWSYIGPAQLFGTAPWWLLQDRPVNPEWDVDEDSSELSPVGARYMKHLDIFISILEEEEKRMPGHEDKELSNLVKWSQESGAMWLHMLLSSGFIDDHIFPFVQLCRHFDGDWTTKKKELNISSEELEKFAARKMNELEKYDETLDRRRERLALVRSGKMSNEEFLALIEQNTPANSSALIEPSSSNNPGHVLEDTRDSAITHGSHVEGGDCYKAHD